MNKTVNVSMPGFDETDFSSEDVQRKCAAIIRQWAMKGAVEENGDFVCTIRIPQPLNGKHTHVTFDVNGVGAARAFNALVLQHMTNILRSCMPHDPETFTMAVALIRQCTHLASKSAEDLVEEFPCS